MSHRVTPTSPSSRWRPLVSTALCWLGAAAWSTAGSPAANLSASAQPLSSSLAAGAQTEARGQTGADGQTEAGARSEHGELTGEIKPVLYVRDVETSAAFFRDRLGFSFLGYTDLEDGPYYAEMAAAGQKFGLHEPTRPIDHQRIGRQRLYFRVRDLAAHRRRIEAWGVEVQGSQETAWMDFFVVLDPDGHEIVFASTGPRHTIDPW